MSALTTRLSLTKPGGGSHGTIMPGEIVDIDVLNDNSDKIDGAVGAPTFSSTTRPASPFLGMLIYETDTKGIARYNGSGWDYMTYDSGWVTLTISGTASAGVPAPQYRKLNGTVFLRGRLASATVGTRFAQLPAGFRPNTTLDWHPSSGGASTVTDNLEVGTDGSFTVTAGATTPYITFSFAADQ